VAARPNILIIAAQKCASIWLRTNLDKHPDVYMRRGALHFFDQHWDNGTDWYFDQFEPPDGVALVGEHCPSYAFPGGDRAITAERIDETLPDVRLLAIVRNPVDRLYSAFIHHMNRDRFAPDADLFESAEKDERRLVSGGRYAEALKPFAERFGDRLKVIVLEDVWADGPAVFRGALDHVGADSGFVPDDLQEVVHSQKPPAESPYFSNGSKRKLTPEERARLHAYFHEDVLELQRLLGRSLDPWLEDADPSS